MNQNLNFLFVYCTFVPAESSLNAQPSPMRKRNVPYDPAVLSIPGDSKIFLYQLGLTDSDMG